MMKQNEMKQHKVEKLEEETSFEIIELEDEMLGAVLGGAKSELSAPCPDGVQCHCR